MPQILYKTDGSPIYDPKDGWKSYDEFQAAALNDMSRIASMDKKIITVNTPNGPVKAVSDQPTQNPQGTGFGKFVSGMLPMVGGVTGTALDEFLGPGGTVAGAALGSMLKQNLQSSNPAVYGQPPNTTMGKTADVLTDTALQGIAPSLGKLLMTGKLANVIGQLGSSLPGGRGLGALLQNIPVRQTLTKGQQVADMLYRLLAARAAGLKNFTPGASSEPQQ